MQEHNYLSSSEQLTALLDGEMDVSETGSLFFELANNDDLQQELQQQIQVRNMLRKSVTPPPADLKKNILASVGMGVAATTAANARNTGKTAAIASSKPFLMAVSGLIASALTAMFLTIGQNPVDGNQMAESIQRSDIMPPATFAVDIPDDNYNTNSNSLPAAPQYAAAEGIADNPSGNRSMLFENNTKNIAASDIPRYYAKHQTYYIPVEYNPDMNLTPSGADEINLFDGLALGIRGFTAASIPDFGVAPLNQPSLNNMSIGLGYELSDNHSFGVEFGQENFQQKYDGDEGDIKYHIDQNYLAFWGGAYYQYTFDKSKELAGIQPFARVFVGATNIGPIQKNLLGLQYKYKNHFSIYGGLETTVLLYRFQNEFFSSQKFGLTYGLNVHL